MLTSLTKRPQRWRTKANQYIWIASATSLVATYYTTLLHHLAPTQLISQVEWIERSEVTVLASVQRKELVKSIVVVAGSRIRDMPCSKMSDEMTAMLISCETEHKKREHSKSLEQHKHERQQQQQQH